MTFRSVWLALAAPSLPSDRVSASDGNKALLAEAQGRVINSWSLPGGLSLRPLPAGCECVCRRYLVVASVPSSGCMPTEVR